ncbi:MAG TPA: signal recognition particle receptor subunit alpha, partial [Polyangiaceae bacterium]|nr:signal recognition particle receptor subunit alpha [Polyangiaceae bacterium]
MTYALLALAIAAIAALFLFLKKKQPAELPPSSTKSQPPPPPNRTSPRRAPAPAPGAPADAAAPSAPKAVPKPPADVTPTPAGAAPSPAVSSSRPPPPSARAVGRGVRDIDGLRKGLSKARGAEGFFGRLRALFTGKKELNADIASELEEVLLSSDVGAETTALLLGRVKDALNQG